MPVELRGKLQDLDPNTPLWRYIKLSSLMLLSTGTAYFPSVEKLSNVDPLEGEIQGDADSFLKAADDQLGPHAGAEFLEWAKGNTEPQWLAEQIADWVFSMEIRKRRACWCWVAQPYESAAMWSIYANAGAAIRTSLAALIESLPASSELEFSIAQICYVDPSNSRLDLASQTIQQEVLLRPHLAKSASYNHEHEVRVVTRCAPGQGVLVTGIAAVTLVKEIMISPILPYSEAEAVKIVLQRLFAKAAINRSALLGEQRWRDEAGASIDKMHAELPARKSPHLTEPLVFRYL